MTIHNGWTGPAVHPFGSMPSNSKEAIRHRISSHFGSLSLAIELQEFAVSGIVDVLL